MKATEELRLRQETPDTPEALKYVPALALSDIPRQASTVPIAVTPLKGAVLLTHDLVTNDVLYAEVAFDMSSVPASLLPFIPLFW